MWKYNDCSIVNLNNREQSNTKVILYGWPHKVRLRPFNNYVTFARVGETDHCLRPLLNILL